MSVVDHEFPWPGSFERAVIEHLTGFDDAQILTSDMRLADYGLTSLRTIALLASIEDLFGIVFSDEMLVPQTFETPGSLWTAVNAALAD